jgi:hypothetical protein
MELFKKYLLKNHRARRAHIYRKAIDFNLFKLWSPGVGRGHNRVKYNNIFTSVSIGKIFQNLFMKPLTPKSSFF